MPSAGPDRRAPHHRAAFAAAAALVVALDQASKHWALQALQDEPIDLVGSLRLNLTFNDGAAFSLGSGRTLWVTLLAVVVSGVLVRMGWRADRRLWAVGVGTVLGGALGNLVDRFLRDGDGFASGHVVDFVDLQWWPVFNLADAALWVGIGMMLLAAWREDDGAGVAVDPRDDADAATGAA